MIFHQAATRVRMLLSRVARFLGGMVVILFLIAASDTAWRHLSYALSEEPSLATGLEQTAQWRADQPFRARLPFDWRHAVHHVDRRHEYTLVPVAGAGLRLIAILPGAVSPKVLGDAPELKGRLVGMGWMGNWDAGELDTEIQLQDEFAPARLKVPPDALLMVPGWRFTLDEYWQVALGAGALIVLFLLVFGVVLRRWSGG
jgi:hypothetical protein